MTAYLSFTGRNKLKQETFGLVGREGYEQVIADFFHIKIYFGDRNTFMTLPILIAVSPYLIGVEWWVTL